MMIRKQLVWKNIEEKLGKVTSFARYIFILLMLGYLLVCLGALGIRLFDVVISGEFFDFNRLKHVLNDALFTLIILAIVKTLFINNNFDYAVTFLEIGFVVILRKLILIEILPDEIFLVLTLGLISALFFWLIIRIHDKKREWERMEE